VVAVATVAGMSIALRRGLVLVGLALAIAVVNWTILRQDRRLAEGPLVYLPLAPLDPRTPFVGDYMRLRYGPEVLPDAGDAPANDRLVLGVDADGVARFRRWSGGAALSAGEFALRIRRDPAGPLLPGLDRFFLQEGDGPALAAARFAAIRPQADGSAALLGLADSERRPLGRWRAPLLSAETGAPDKPKP